MDLVKTCPFCRILSEDKKRIIRQTENTFTVLSNPRLMPGHLLVIPKRHIEKFSELTEAEKNELFNEAIKLQEKILEKYGGCDLSQHYRPFIVQNRLKVNHLHIHLRPREFEDELYKKVQIHEQEAFTDLSEPEFQKYKNLFS